MLIIIRQPGQHLGQMTGLLADFHHFMKQDRKILSGRRDRVGQGLTAAHGAADLLHRPSGRAAGILRLALPVGASIDAGLQRNAHPSAKAGKLQRGNAAIEHN